MPCPALVPGGCPSGAASPGTASPGTGLSGSGPSDELLESVLTIMRMARVMERVDAGLSPQQYRMLKLAGGGGERSARLAERLAVAKPTLTAIADSLVAAGLARRIAEPGDRRVVRLQLTEAGSVAVLRADAVYAQWLADLLERTGRAEQVQDDLRLVGAAMDERRRTLADGAPAAGTPAADGLAVGGLADGGLADAAASVAASAAVEPRLPPEAGDGSPRRTAARAREARGGRTA